MRNRIGAMGQEKLVRCILSCMNVRGIFYDWSSDGRTWYKKPVRTRIHKRLSRVWKCEIMTIASADGTEIS